MSEDETVDRQTYNAMECLACILASHIMELEGWYKEELEAELRWELLSHIRINESLEEVVRRLAKLADDRYPFLKPKDVE